ncbi:coiled-coil domain-containing protein 158-like isoform X2 [Clytia hemisphaerica]|uniref:Uncharacterized protein n=1 Tax=Clytia hemisphaerica TaxID=252671 RepID=A0A7M5WTK5_9CNID
MMDEAKAFESLKQDLVDKSQQLKNLRMEIACNSQADTHPMIPLSTIHQPFQNPQAPINKITSPRVVPSSQQITPGQITPSDSVLSNYQYQIETLQRKLRVATDLCTEQEMESKTSLKEAELNFRQLLTQRDSFIKLRESESNNQQQLISHLQLTLEKLEMDKAHSEETIQQLNQFSKVQKNEIDSLKKQLDTYNKSFNSLSLILLPDMKSSLGGKFEDMNSISVTSIANMVEKLLLCHRKQDEMMKFKIQNLEGKLSDQDKSSEEKLKYEKRFIEVRQQELVGQMEKSLQAKETEITSLKGSLQALETKYQNALKRFKEEILKYKASMAESEKLFETKYNEITDQKDKAVKKLTKLQNGQHDVSNLNHTMKTELKNLRENVNKKTKEYSDAKQEKKKAEKETEKFKQRIKEMVLADEQKSLESRTTISNLEDHLSHLEVEYENLQLYVQELTERLRMLPQEIESQVQGDEQQKYEAKMQEINKLIENHKSVLENANIEIESKSQLVKAGHDQIKLLQKKVESLKSDNAKLKEKNKELESKLGQRETRLVDLQLVATESKEALKAYSTKEMQNRKALECSQKMNLQFQGKVDNMHKEKVDLEVSYDLLKKQFRKVEEDMKKLDQKIRSQTQEIDTVTKDRKAIAKKLKEKNDALISMQQKHEINSKNICMVKESNFELQKSCEDLVKHNTNLSSDLRSLEEAKFKLEKLLTEKEVLKDQEVENLLQRLQGSEADINRLKKLLKRFESSGNTQAKIASMSQKAVTKQRDEVDSIKVKLNWMKEALEVSEKTRSELQQELEHKEEGITELEHQLKREKESVHNLSINLSLQQQETKGLHKALEQASMKYSDVYALVEKQEQRFIKGLGRRGQIRDQDKLEPSEIKSLLEDVRGLLSSTLKKSSSSRKKSPNSPRSPRQRSKADDKWLTNSLKLGRNSEKLNEYLNSFDQNSTSGSVVGASSPMNSTPNGRTRKKVTIEEDQSSVYSFDYTTDEESEYPIQHPMLRKHKQGGTAAKRLQEKLNNLKKMGEDLTNNNKDIANSMTKHSQKLEKLTIS